MKEEDQIEVRGEKCRLSAAEAISSTRRLRHLIFHFKINMYGYSASTGGFTDCMLQNGAAKVFSVDVGYGQLAGSFVPMNAS